MTGELVKYRTGKISVRAPEGRIWIADKELNETVFKPGAPFDVRFDEDSHTVYILPGGRRIVSARKQGEKVSSIIDIKNLRVKHTLESCDYITIAIYRDRIVVRGQKRTDTLKKEEYQQDKAPLTLTSFTFYNTDAPAVEAGFTSRGCLFREDGEGIVYSVPIDQFEPDVLPKADVWFIRFSGSDEEYARTVAHVIRLLSEVPGSKRPFAVVLEEAKNSPQAVLTLEVFLQDCGYQKEQVGEFSVFSVLGKTGHAGTAQNVYRLIYQHLMDSLSRIPKRLPITLVSFYCGCISDLAFKEAGFKILKAYDLSKEIAKTIPGLNFSNPMGSYINNIGDWFEPADLTKLDFDSIPEADVYFFSPECHGLTIENQRTRALDNPKNIHMRISIEILKAKKPLMFALEQVPDILRVGKGAFLREITEELRDIYYLSYAVIDAADVGSPQHRRRFILFGSRLGEIAIPAFKPERYKTVGEALSGVTEDMFNQQDITRSNPKDVERFKHVPPGGNWRSVPDFLWDDFKPGPATHSNIMRRLDPDRPSCTITNFRKARFIHPYENRLLSVREAARLMDVPDLYEFLGTLGEKQQQIANGIPLNLVRTIAEILRNHYQEHYLKKDWSVIPPPRALQAGAVVSFRQQKLFEAEAG